jgi:hypothetical protein
LPFQRLPDLLREQGNNVILISLGPQQLVWYGPKNDQIIEENILVSSTHFYCKRKFYHGGVGAASFNSAYILCLGKIMGGTQFPPGDIDITSVTF